MMTRIMLGSVSLAVVIVHACWKWGSAGGPSFAGVNGPGLFGVVFFAVWLLWPMFVISIVCVAKILFGPYPPSKKITQIALFAPILLYGSYFLIAGGSGLKAGAE